MPLLRGVGFHWMVRGEFKRGELPVTATGDTREFRFPPRPPKPGVGDSPVSMGVLDGDLLVFGWQPLYVPIGGTGFMVFIGGLVALWFYYLGAGANWGWQGLVMTPFGFWMLIWYPFVAAYQRLVIFDRRRGLVHLPRWFSRRRLDAVRFADANVLVVDVPAGYMGLSPVTEMFVARPGWSLARGEYPSYRARIGFAGARANTDAAEQSWRRIVTFMTEPREASGWVAWKKRNMGAMAKLDYDDDWAAMRWAESREFRRFYRSELLTEPNWVCDEEGRWQRLPEGPRERIELPDGPEEKRVPV